MTACAGRQDALFFFFANLAGSNIRMALTVSIASKTDETLNHANGDDGPFDAQPAEAVL